MKNNNFDFHTIDVSSHSERDELHEFLKDCTDSFRYSRGGHVPDEVVENVIRKKFISPEVIESFEDFGTRFALRCEGILLGSVLVSNKPDDLFIIDADTMRVPLSKYPDYSPEGYHNVINYLVHPDARGKGVGRSLVQGLHDNRSNFSGKGISYRSEPPSFPAYVRMGGIHLPEYDKFSTHPNSPVPPGFASNKEFNDRYVPEASKIMHADKIDNFRYKYALIINNTVFLMTINTPTAAPSDGKEYLKELAQKQRPALSSTSFEIIPKIIQKNAEIIQSVLYSEANEIWNHDLFNKDGRVPIGVLDTTELLSVPVDAYANEMLIKMPGSDTLVLPDNFKPLAPLIQDTIDIDATHFERFKDDYVYLTYQEDFMQADGFQRFHGCHVDGFQSHRVDPKLPIDRLYLAVDKDPTIFYPHAFDMSSYDTQTHDFFAVFNELANEDKAFPLTSYGLFLCNAVSVHRAAPTTKAGLRRFFRLTCSRRINDRAGCSKNPHLDYDWDFRLQQTRASVKGIVK